MQAWGLGMTWAFLLLSLVALAVSRALNVYPLAAVVNFMRPKDVAIPRRHQHMLWFSGLRGAIAFALSLSAAADLGGGLAAPHPWVAALPVHTHAWTQRNSLHLTPAWQARPCLLPPLTSQSTSSTRCNPCTLSACRARAGLPDHHLLHHPLHRAVQWRPVRAPAGQAEAEGWPLRRRFHLAALPFAHGERCVAQSYRLKRLPLRPSNKSSCASWQGICWHGTEHASLPLDAQNWWRFQRTALMARAAGKATPRWTKFLWKGATAATPLSMYGLAWLLRDPLGSKPADGLS